MVELGTFIPPVVNALPATNGSGRVARFATDGELYEDVSGGWRKLRSSLKASIVTPVTGGVNVTTDVVFATLTIPAGTLLVGDVFNAEALGTSNNGTTATTLTFWVRVNGGIVTSAAYAMGTTAATNTSWHMRGILTARAIGASGVMAVNHLAIWKGGWSVTSNPQTTNVVTTSPITITIGATMSVANASNGVTANQAFINLV